MFGDLGKMMKLAAQMRQKLPQLKAEMEASTYEASAGDGVVTATVNGKLALVDIKIAPEYLTGDDCDGEMLEDLIKAAVGAGQDKASQASQEAMMKLTGGMQLPGMQELIP